MAKKSPSAIDLHVGARIRRRRQALGYSQEKLAAALGVTFQQIQKYEKGQNRIGAGRLYEISRALDIAVQYFFDGAPGETPDESRAHARNEEVERFLASPEGLQLGLAFAQIKDPSTRRRLSALVSSLAAEG